VGEWEILSNMPKARAAGASVYMHNRVWVVGGVGPGVEMQSYDIRTGEWELFPGAPVVSRNHLQAVVFENEIWWMAGRTISADKTTNNVQIWNPVTREWREGPPMNHARAGHAAKVVQGQIIVAGGEVIEAMGLTQSLEVFAPGADTWVLGQGSPITVHGTTGAVVDGEFVLVGGSDIAGRLSENLATQVLTPAKPANPGNSFSLKY
jgi:N-acetylneuraminic acid mutarotase